MHMNISSSKLVHVLFLGSKITKIWNFCVNRHMQTKTLINMMTSSNGNIFRVIGRLWGKFPGHRRIPLTEASDAEVWCFFDLRLNKLFS